MQLCNSSEENEPSNLNRVRFVVKSRTELCDLGIPEYTTIKIIKVRSK